jgi:hypothetical protein
MHQTHWGEARGLAPDNVTIHVGNPHHDVVMDRDETIWMNNVHSGMIPELSIRDKRTNRLTHGGWRRILIGMVQAHLLRLTPDIVEWLGTNYQEKARKMGISLEEAA